MPDSRTTQRGFYIAATKKSSGKTVISLGLGAALTESGLNVQSYKKGPDYIDPMWHQAATGRPCFNLDFFTQTHDEINHTFNLNRQSADVVYVEGNKGLFDGMDTLGSDCNAALAEQLSLPVVLIVNAQGITRGIAPMLKGYEAFAEGIRYAGVILNEVAGPRHQQKLIKAIETYTDLRILGVVPKLSKLHLEERHLGLVPQNEAGYADAYIRQTARLVKDNVDIARLLEASAEIVPGRVSNELASSDASRLKIGVARDRAFGFYYPDDLQAMQAMGAELYFFDTLKDKQLPDVDALFIGGGFPETQASALQANRLMRVQIKAFVESGKPVYAECGGLMYLCHDISYQGTTSGMVGVIDAQVEMTERPIGRGYAKIKQQQLHLWATPPDDEANVPRACHEFHYSQLSGPAVDSGMAYEVARGHGVNGQGDGIMVHNTLAMYCHQRHTRNNPWVEQFINFIRQHKQHENN